MVTGICFLTAKYLHPLQFTRSSLRNNNRKIDKIDTNLAYGLDSGHLDTRRPFPDEVGM